ncbi:MAG TPA: phosphoglucosamine mutase [Actinomycetota bacterium]|nr:phosphoglucosamine mutase [Actinomycetota bacterium]
MARLFGTDGVRGIANLELTGELAFRLGRALVTVLAERGERRPQVVVGRDTRASGDFLEAALCAGICSAGGDALLVGVFTTPGVAFLTTALGAQAGAVISASHNPAEYNGIKFFAGTGYKFPDEVEDEIEALVGSEDGPRPTGRAVGRIHTEPGAAERYLRHLEAAAPCSLEGMRLVVDCAHGAACALAPELLRRLGARVEVIGDRPDGANINEGYGATHPQTLARAVVERGAEAGVAHDGDADRAIFADHRGNVLDGDQVLAACALDLYERGELDRNLVVCTVMANLGFRKRMREAGIEVVETRVGDRYVLEEMLARGAVLGGEQSGHIIFLRHATTGDGLLTAVQFLGLARRKGASVADLASVISRYPQVLLNVEVARREELDRAAPVWEAVRQAQAELGDSGRVLVRPSGTEPLVRVMVEAPTEEEARRHAEAVAAAVRAALGGP